jgi:hypothetical protein
MSQWKQSIKTSLQKKKSFSFEKLIKKINFIFIYKFASKVIIFQEDL